MKLIVAGSRGFIHLHWWQRAFDMLDKILEKYPDLEVISGCCQGADHCGEAWAKKHGLDKQGRLHLRPAKWKVNGRINKGAGRVRNAQMAEEGTHLLAFYDGTSPGTAHMIEVATAKGLTVHVENYLNWS